MDVMETQRRKQHNFNCFAGNFPIVECFLSKTIHKLTQEYKICNILPLIIINYKQPSLKKLVIYTFLIF